MFNDYGYDYFQSDDTLSYDETFYTEMAKPTLVKENFDNEIDEILEEIEPNDFNQKNI